MTYTPHVWSRHDKLDHDALNNLENAVGGVSNAQFTATDSSVAPVISSGTQTQAALNAQTDAHLGGDSTGLASMTYRVDTHGAVGDGTTDDTAAINSLISSTPNGSIVQFTPNKSYLISGSLLMPSKSGITLQGRGATLKMSPTEAGYAAFVCQTSSDRLTIEGFTVKGSGVVADGHQGFGNSSGVEITNLRILNNTITDVTIGVSLNADTAGHVTNSLVQGNTIARVVGGVAGQGYGIHHASNDFTNSANVRIIGNTLTDCGRHSIYQARGRGVVIAGNTITNHRQTVAAGGDLNALPAIMLSRSIDVAVSGNVVTNSSGGMLMVGGNETAPNKSGNYTITGNTFSGFNGSTGIPLQFGQTAPTTDFFPTGVVFGSNVIDSTGYTGGTVAYVYSGKHVMMSGNVFRIDNASAATTVIRVLGSGETAGTATYTDDLIVSGNLFVATGTFIVTPVRLSGSETTAIRMKFANNTHSLTTTSNTFALSVALSNPNVTVSGQSASGISFSSGVALRSEDSAVGKFGANGTLPQGKVALTSSSTAADIVAALKTLGISS